MDWDVVAALAELVAALGVIASLVYVAQQLRASQRTATDSNRLNRSRGVCEIFLKMASDDVMRRRWVKFNDMESHYEEMGAQFDGSIEDASANDCMNAYWFWLHWGQFSSTTDKKDLDDLKLVIHPYAYSPSMTYSWEHSVFAKSSFDNGFRCFVEATMKEYRESPGAATAAEPPNKGL